MDCFKVMRYESVIPTHQVIYNLRSTEFLLPSQSVSAVFNQSFVDTGNVCFAVLIKASESKSSSQESGDIC